LESYGGCGADLLALVQDIFFKVSNPTNEKGGEEKIED